VAIRLMGRQAHDFGVGGGPPTPEVPETVTPPEDTGQVTHQQFQILSLDGGGYMGMFSAAVLACLEDDLGTSIADHFDLIAGTSTGGIIALALAAGLPARRVVDFYLEHGPRIFGHRRLRLPKQLVRSKYRTRPLHLALRDVLGERILSDSRVPLVIPSYDLRSDDIKLFRTPHHPRLIRDWREQMVDVALATSAAPTYLGAHHLRGLRLVDGGVWANNPSIVALCEAVETFKVDLEDIRVFSLGTTSDLERRPDRLDHGGVIQWAPKVAKVILRGQSLGAANATELLLRRRGQFLRLDPRVPEKELRLDGVTPQALLGRAERESEHISKQFNAIFADHRPKPYTPLYTQEMEPEPDADQ